VNDVVVTHKRLLNESGDGSDVGLLCAELNALMQRDANHLRTTRTG